ncbi:MAG: transporter ATP-binding protein [Bacteroidota bacterium]|nr:transporter ATP-binding protein [Bacteroidota bacterium]
MTIQLENISKRFGFEWIFKQVNFQFETGKKYAVTGANGSGKSTLLKIISGGLVPTSGKVNYSLLHKRTVEEEQVAKEISFAAPYISLIEDFSLEELYQFHSSFKKMLVQSQDEFLSVSGLAAHRKKYIKNFSSGMKQRLKLSLSFLTDSQTLLLDEPTSNFDSKTIDWYFDLVQNYSAGRLLIIGSNQEYEYNFCEEKIGMSDYK